MATLYEQWKQMAELAGKSPDGGQTYWNEYFQAEKENYAKLLAAYPETDKGTLKELAAKYSMEPQVFTGFMDGINDSLKESVDVEKLEEDTEIDLDIDWEKLFYNMLDAKAKWLSSLKEWDGVLSEETRHEITRKWRLSGQAKSEKTVGRNDPCPCGSGKKYKKCCGKNA